MSPRYPLAPAHLEFCAMQNDPALPGGNATMHPENTPHVVLRLDFECGCKSFYPLSLLNYCAEPALTALALMGVYPSFESANNAAKSLAAAAQREWHS